MKLLEDGGDVFSGAGVGEEAGSRILDVLQLLEMRRRKTIEEAIAVVESGCDEGVNEYFSCGLGEGGTDAGDVAEMKEGGFSEVADV